MQMSSHTPVPCPHERRPGTALCLHCRHAERNTKRTRRYRILAKLGLVGVGVALCIGGGIAGVSALYRNGSAAQAAERTSAAEPTRSPASTAPSLPAPQALLASATAPAATRSRPLAASEPAGGVPIASGSSVQSVVLQGSAAPVAAAPTPAAASLAPIVPDGRSDLRDSIYVVRLGDTVRVYFDTPDARTRRPEKFELVVRATLPAVYGAQVDSALAAVAVGSLATQGDLLNDLPTRGVRVTLASGVVVTLWPETRPGINGPLVVAYRSVVGR